MSDPMFAVYFTLSRLYELDGKMGEAQKAHIEAEARLRQMKIKNTMIGWYQEDTVEDRHYEQGVSGFGE